MLQRLRSTGSGSAVALAVALLSVPRAAPLLQAQEPPRPSDERIRLEVEIVGIDDPLLANVEALVGIVREAASGDVRPGHVYRLHEKAPEQIATALQPYGFYSPVVRPSLNSDSSPWRARYVIDPGPPTIVTRLDVRIEGEASEDSVFQQTIASLPVAESDTLNHPSYELAKQTLGLLAADRGYLDANWDSSVVRVDRDANSAEIVLHMTSGPRFFFGPVSIDQDWIDEDILAPYVVFEQGEPYNSADLRELQSGLAGTTYFANVEITPRRDLADENLQVPIEIHVRPRKTQRWEVGIGYGTDTGPRIRLTTEFRRLNSRGHYADLDARISTTEQSLTGRYNIPVGLPDPSLWTITGRYGRIEWVTSKTLQGLAGLSYGHLRGPVREVFSLRYQHDDFVVAADSGVSNLTQPTASWTWSTADNRLYATRGLGGTLELRGAVEGIASSATFYRAFLTAKTILPLGPKFRGIAKADVGWLGTDQFSGLPPSIRFFAGGDRSIRGFDYQSLGPLNSDDQVTGGNSLLVGSAEVEYRILEKWSAAVFVDAGNAFRDFSGDIAIGTGVGARWISPVGLIRIDFGFGLDKPEGERPLRLHLSIGPDF
jgi:translocation and assembly module TamA